MTARVIIIGKSGQLAQALVASVPGFAAVMTCLGRDDLPSHAPHILEQALDGHHPDIVINAAAFSAVDLAEVQQEEMMALNATLPIHLAAHCRARKIPFIHISSDYVFDGTKRAPYLESDPLCPINAYGRSKAAADLGVMAAMPEAAIVRTSWVFGVTGASFPQKIIAAGRKNKAVTVVNDQIGRPTFAGDLADAVLTIAAHALDRHPGGAGIINFANTGAASWFDIAKIVIDAVNAHDGSAIALSPISSESLNLAAQRPGYSVLDTALYEKNCGPKPRSWQSALELILPKLLG